MTVLDQNGWSVCKQRLHEESVCDIVLDVKGRELLCPYCTYSLSFTKRIFFKYFHIKGCMFSGFLFDCVIDIL